MDDHNDLTAYEDLGPAQRSTCGDKPMQTSKPSGEIRRLISELGLRYRPSVQADLAEHAALLGLLARDLADLDPRDLAEAIDDHVRQSPFMPKACELIQLADTARANREFRERPVAPAIEYEPYVPPEPIIPCTPEEARAIMVEYGLGENPLLGVKIGSKADGTTEHFVDRHI